MEANTFTPAMIPGAGQKNALESLFGRVVKKGDYYAFRELFTNHYRYLCNYAMRVVETREIAEEVVADVFVKLWKNREQIEVHTSFQAYIYRAVRNQALDYLKLKMHRQYEKESLDSIQWSMSHADHFSPMDELAFNETYNHIERCIQALPCQCQVIFRLSREEGLRYKDIAEKLNISVKTVETQMSRALKVLRERVPAHRLVA
ncbi:RNA polymerase sigma-70 factor (ECF subfamily) [Dyadobacter jejuensis]|uniref:RNA polymerase sigma-70 factor (ECF subfamily) n=1 Tax=Dyadobacter jejuensis TaxID=1082580 RepID=A0A316BC00_9BACT|nr:RNA polymerase sigma-70 factor [Dyadobacter jejuensis]PWJ60007.1 RNA polymerase sigma-70 factor (ECF subfamily) [Dyadobacter jejuensis]